MPNEQDEPGTVGLALAQPDRGSPPTPRERRRRGRRRPDVVCGHPRDLAAAGHRPKVPAHADRAPGPAAARPHRGDPGHPPGGGPRTDPPPMAPAHIAPPCRDRGGGVRRPGPPRTAGPQHGAGGLGVSAGRGAPPSGWPSWADTCGAATPATSPDLEAQLAQANDKVASLQQQVDDLTAQQKDLQDRIDQLVNENQDLTGQGAGPHPGARRPDAAARRRPEPAPGRPGPARHRQRPAPGPARRLAGGRSGLGGRDAPDPRAGDEALNTDARLWSSTRPPGRRRRGTGWWRWPCSSPTWGRGRSTGRSATG